MVTRSLITTWPRDRTFTGQEQDGTGWHTIGLGSIPILSFVEASLMKIALIMLIVFSVAGFGVIYHNFISERLTNWQALPALFLLEFFTLFLGTSLVIENMTDLLAIRFIGSLFVGLGVTVGAIRARQLTRKGMAQYRESLENQKQK